MAKCDDIPTVELMQSALGEAWHDSDLSSLFYHQYTFLPQGPN
jgi:hypothetical protein